MEPLLVANNLRKSFGKVTAVNGLSLKLEPGECLALLGPNGAGKTTTVEMLEGLQTPDSGEIHIFGKNLRIDRRHILQDVGVMLQETALYKKMTVRETLELFGSFFHKSLKPSEAIALVELQEKADDRLEALSGGQKQRAYLACALINEPRLLFLDEPTTGLDPQARRMIWDLLERHKGKERSILLTTHYMDEAEKLADRVAIVDHGTIIAEGSPTELIKKICGEQILCFRFSEGALPKYSGQLYEKLSWLKEAKIVDERFELTTSETISRIGELQRCVDQLGLKLEELEMRRATLEDVFITLTGRSMRDA
jgi:ABC-2 type transport system ATP-binding protein